MIERRRGRQATDDRPSLADLLAMAQGRWYEILIDAGMPPDSLEGRKGRPCPNCGGRDRFAPLPDFENRGAVMCRKCFSKENDPRPGDGLATLRWWLGYDAMTAIKWLESQLRYGSFYSSVEAPEPNRQQVIASHSEPNAYFAELAGRCRASISVPQLRLTAELLGLPPEPLERLGVGWEPDSDATTWPMYDANGFVIGIRLRCPKSGKKWAVKGSRNGLFVPAYLKPEVAGSRLFVCEGPTDTAAVISLGLAAVGVPSAGVGGDMLAQMIRSLDLSGIVIVADGDQAGIDGAKRLASYLADCADVRIMAPPNGIKDVRDWVVQGADRSTFLRTTDFSPRVEFESPQS